MTFPSRFRAPRRRILPGGLPIPGRLQSPWRGTWAAIHTSLVGMGLPLALGIREDSDRQRDSSMVSESCSASSSSTASSLLPWPKEKPPGDAVGKAMIPDVRLIRIIRADPALPFFQGRRRGARQLQEVRDPLPGEPPDTPGTQSHLFQERVCAEFPPPQWQVCRRHCQHVGLGTTSNCWRTPRRGRVVNQRRRSGTCRYRTPHTPPEARAGRFSSSRARRPETESSPGTSGSRFL